MPSISECTSTQCLEQGLHLRLSYYPFPIYISSIEDEKTGEVEMMGVIPQHILPFVFGSLNISYEFIVSDEFSHGAPVINGTWPGEMGLLQEKVVDVCVGAQYVDYYHVLDFCPLEPYQRLTINFLASYGIQELFDFFTFLYQIEKTVWHLFIVAFVLIMALSSISDTMNDGKWNRSIFLKNMWKSMWIYLASVFCEGSPHTMSSRLGQLLQFLWLFVVLVFVNVLYSQFKGILMVNHGSDYLQSVQDLAKSSHIYPLVLPNSILEYILRDSPLVAYRSVYERALSEPEKCFVDGSQFIDTDIYQMVKDGTHVILASISFFKYVLKNICHTLIGSRKLYFIPENVAFTDFAFYTNWDFPEYIRNNINQRFLIMKECGFGDLWFSDYYRGFERCEDADQSNKDENMLLKLKHLNTAFILYLYLLLQSMLVFVFENLINIYQKKGVL